MKTIKIYYRRNLKMSPGKIAAQAVHAALGLVGTDFTKSVIVLSASDTKFEAFKKQHPDAYIVRDAGYTEIPPFTETCLAIIENEEDAT